jgi:pyrimidine and pyridine-specific 5'-nucleotidase
MASTDDRYIIWFDIDNTLYSASSQISEAMGKRIHGSNFRLLMLYDQTYHFNAAYFVTLGLGHEEASELHHRYYTQYGLALRGLVRHHDVGEYPFHLLSEPYLSTRKCVDPMDFNNKCDGSLPLEDMIKPDPSIRKLFQDIDRSKVCVIISP